MSPLAADAAAPIDSAMHSFLFRLPLYTLPLINHLPTLATKRNSSEGWTLLREVILRCLKKVPTFKLSVTLSNAKPIFKIFALLESV